MSPAQGVAVILGSAHGEPHLAGAALEAVAVETPHGEVRLHRFPGRAEGQAWVLYRHGAPHRLLPHQIPYRAHAAALREVGCGALLVTSSVGVLDDAVPLDTPILVRDLLMPDNRLPDGSACTMFGEPSPGQGHLVLEEGLFSGALSAQVEGLLDGLGWPPPPPVLFAYVGGPRTKTAAENGLLRQQGAQVNSMSLGPEVVLANELEIPTTALVVGHKRSSGDWQAPLDHEAISASLRTSGEIIDRVAAAWLARARTVPFGNRIHRYG